MKIDVTKEQIEFEKLSNGLMCVTYYPCNRFAKKKKHFILLEPGTRYYEMANKVNDYPDNWVMLNYLAMFIETYDGQIISAI